jgi:hypothetical protein
MKREASRGGLRLRTFHGGFHGKTPLRPLYGSNTVVLVNDHRGHAAVLALFDEAMAAM